MWQDQTIRVQSEGDLEITPDGDVHVTWQEAGTTLTLITTKEEAKRLVAKLAEAIAAAAIVFAAISTVDLA
jgi:hypothetical protein